MTDKDAIGDSNDRASRADPALPPTLAQDLSVLVWLQSSSALSAQTTGYICDALLGWALRGQAWPDPADPIAGPEVDDLAVLTQVTDRLAARVRDPRPTAARFDLAALGRDLRTAIRCQQDPQGLADRRERELLRRQPWLADPPGPVLLADGRVL